MYDRTDHTQGPNPSCGSGWAGFTPSEQLRARSTRPPVSAHRGGAGSALTSLLLLGTALLGASLASASVLEAQLPGAGRDSTAIPIDTVRVQGRIDSLVGIAQSASEGRVGAIDLRSRPITREGELLETVPGMIVTQHSGEGKANQYFIRGFNLDHGTDFQTRVEGMPVNMPSHGHGQGYTDLNFMVPEFVEHLDYKLGVSHAELGDFGSAGGAAFHLVRSFERPFASATLGENGFARLLAGGSQELRGGDLLAGAELKFYDGPWEQSDEVQRFNGIARYSRNRGPVRWSLLGMAYHNRWNANDQIPLRAIENGLIGRFGQIDDQNGGDSQRYSLSGSLRHLGGNSAQEVQLFGIYSDLNLFSNFTYFLEDTELGDQLKQKDRRFIVGGDARHLQEVRALGSSHGITLGVQSRIDLIPEVGLHRTLDQEIASTIRSDRVTETSTGLYLEADSRWHPLFRTVLGVRGDALTFDVESDREVNSGTASAAIVSPKGSLIFTPSSALEFYLNGGLGFHSNDARGTTITIDPATGEPAAAVDPLVRSRGAEIGMRLEPLERLRTTLSLWALDLESELLFSGDAGATEASDPSERRGITWANFYRPIPQLAIDADLSLSRARLTEVEAGEDRIPGAIEQVFTGGITWTPAAGAFGSLRVRHFGEYPLNEDNSVRAGAATLFNAEVGYLLRSGIRIETAILNLLDANASDIEYYYASRLPGEPAAGIEDIHFHPVEPRQVRVSLHWVF